MIANEVIKLVHIQLKARETGQMHLSDLYKNIRALYSTDLSYPDFITIIGLYRKEFDIPSGEIGVDVSIISRCK